MVTTDSRFEGVNRCFQCGMCSAICPAAEASNYNPRRAVYLVSRRDTDLGDVSREVCPSDCFQCYSCNVCPRGVSAGGVMKYAREAIGENGKDRRLGLLRENLIQYGQSIVPEVFDNATEVWGDSWRDLKESKRYLKARPKKRTISQKVTKEVSYLMESAKSLRLRTSKRSDQIYGDLTNIDDLVLFQSCCGASHYPGIAKSSMFIMNKMGFHPKILDEQSCCGGFAYYANDLNYNELVLVGARNQALIENCGEIVTSECTTCFSSNWKLQEILINKDNRRHINDILSTIGKKTNGLLNATHIEEVLYRNIDLVKSHIELDLDELKIATHSGCHYRNFSMRPEKNRMLKELVKVTGARVVGYPSENRCCGGGFEKSFVGEIDKVRKLNLEKQKSIINSGADLLIVDCPGCLMTFDRNHPELKKTHPINLEYLHISQFIAFAMGADSHKIVGMQHHSVPFVSTHKKAKRPRIGSLIEKCARSLKTILLRYRPPSRRA